tara:strand:- start:136 stop:450 length:315 start_codon:yes stop_codon:yes gene_type:complete
MSEFGSDITLEIPVHVDHDFEVDADGISYIVTFLYIDDDEDAIETRVSLEGVTDDLCEYYGDIDGYQRLYSIAHEFSRVAEKLRSTAGRIEDSSDAVDDLFNID